MFSMHIHIQYAHSHSVCTFSMYMNALVIMYMYQSTQLLYSSSCHRYIVSKWDNSIMDNHHERSSLLTNGAYSNAFTARSDT